jgi:hypothetical protein
MFYKTHEIETLHPDNHIEYSKDTGTYTVYGCEYNPHLGISVPFFSDDYEIIAVYVNTYTGNRVINGIHRIK